MASTPTTTAGSPICAVCESSNGVNGGSLLRCKRCASTFYCSRSCQKKDWPNHKMPCKAIKEKRDKEIKEERDFNRHFAAMGVTSQTRDDVIHAGAGIKIVPTAFPQADNGVVYMLVPQVTLPLGAASFPWVQLPITAALGFPLQFVRIPTGDPTLSNEHMDQLTMESDWKAAEFGQSIIGGPATGSVCVVRVDGEELHMNHVSALVTFIREDLKEVRGVKAREAKGEVVDRREISTRLITAKRFVEVFQRIKQAESANNAQEKKVWKGVECPVKLD